MTKRKLNKEKQSNNQTKIIGIGLAIVVLIGSVLFLTNNNQSSTVVASIIKETITPQDYQSTYVANNSDHILLDVRTPEEFNSGHITGAVNIPVQELEQRLSEVPPDKDVVVYCRSGNRSAQASTILANNNFSNIYDMGGIIAWQEAGYAIE